MIYTMDEQLTDIQCRLERVASRVKHFDTDAYHHLLSSINDVEDARKILRPDLPDPDHHQT